MSSPPLVDEQSLQPDLASVFQRTFEALSQLTPVSDPSSSSNVTIEQIEQWKSLLTLMQSETKSNPGSRKNSDPEVDEENWSYEDKIRHLVKKGSTPVLGPMAGHTGVVLEEYDINDDNHQD
eukprot:CAMPEP_0118637788 /NCGR_PEP_ID=MMETSP0785-20121206/3338_1 /TAXON_ID=91992 /ORGANISM="Bolidomonas pacifica, Strain CCMP 1866" /LENGTH=121 /DNA_ID=CAMNT_0006528995 /DNA_START=44 /DNA_END=406 /DNA_ORIENTATION=+